MSKISVEECLDKGDSSTRPKTPDGEDLVARYMFDAFRNGYGTRPLEKLAMTSQDTLVLIEEAKRGDTKAWAELINRFYNGWFRRFHGNLDYTVRKLYDTQDLVQSAVADAIKDISSLEHDAAFFVWVNAIIRHKIATRRRRLCRERTLADSTIASSGAAEHDTGLLDDYVECLDTILSLFPGHPQAMAAVSLKLVDGLKMKDVAERLDRPERTVYRWVEEGLFLLKENMKS